MCFRAFIYVGPANEPLPHAYATANIGYQLTGVVTFSHIQRARETAGSSDALVANGFRHSLGKAFYHLILNKHAGPDCQRPRICLSYPAGLFSALPYILHNHEYEPQTPTDPDVHSDSTQIYSHTRMLACTHLRQNTHTICCTIRPEGERRQINIYIYRNLFFSSTRSGPVSTLLYNSTLKVVLLCYYCLGYSFPSRL